MDDSAPSSAGHLGRFHCWKCGGKKAYRSRPRGFFEKRLLPLLLLKPVRCESCFHRAYVLWTTAAVEPAGLAGKLPKGQSGAVAATGERIA